MTGLNGKKQKAFRSAYLTPVVALILSSFLFMGVGFAGISSSSEVSGYVGTGGIVIELEDEYGVALAPGQFSSNNTITFTKIENKYNIFIGSYKLGESVLTINASDSAAGSISLSADVGHMILGESEYTDGYLPYGLIHRLVVEDESGNPISDLSDITIGAGSNKFNVKFYGDIESKYISDDEPLNFAYYVLFKVTASD